MIYQSLYKAVVASKASTTNLGVKQLALKAASSAKGGKSSASSKASTSAQHKGGSVTKSSSRKPAAKREAATKGVVQQSLPVAKHPYPKSEIVKSISDRVGITRKQASETIRVLGDIVNVHLKPGSCGQIKLLGVKFVVAKRPPRPQRTGIHPVSGEKMVFKAKPAQMVVRAKILKQLRQITEGK